MTVPKFKNVDEYIASFRGNIRLRLNELRDTIKQTAPGAIESISYNMPSYKYKGMLAYFAAHTQHVGFYPMASPIKAFEKELDKYKTSKGTVQFPLDKTIPKTLVKKLLKFRMKENEAKELAKKNN
jgi:uncharacterized protein YdhG (YjbR/CyaY superfamily)